jgi:flagellar protein FliS
MKAMVTNNPYQSYQENAVQTASPGELTLMLYNGCLKFIKLARKAIEEKNMEERNTNLLKAQKIIRELMVTLNMEYDVAKPMMLMYDYIYRRLVEANIKNDVAILEEVEGYVTEFRDTWKQVIQINRQRQYAQGGQA